MLLQQQRFFRNEMIFDFELNYVRRFSTRFSQSYWFIDMLKIRTDARQWVEFLGIARFSALITVKEHSKIVSST